MWNKVIMSYGTMEGLVRGSSRDRIRQDERGNERTRANKENQRARTIHRQAGRQADRDESFHWTLPDRTYHESTRSFLARVAIFTLNDDIRSTESEVGNLRQGLQWRGGEPCLW